MSLVAYDSSDDSTDEIENVTEVKDLKASELCLPATSKQNSENSAAIVSSSVEKYVSSKSENPTESLFGNLPQPKTIRSDILNEAEVDILSNKVKRKGWEKPGKKDHVPVKITLPSLLQFKDLEEDNEKKRKKVEPSKKGTGLFAILPPPKGSITMTSKSLIPNVLNKKILNEQQPKIMHSENRNSGLLPKLNTRVSVDVDSYLEEEEVNGELCESGKIDFFSLSEEKILPNSKPLLDDATSILESTSINKFQSVINVSHNDVKNEILTVENSNYMQTECNTNSTVNVPIQGNTAETLTTSVYDLPREEILLKNKAEIGPKLPVPEQEYNLDSEGNLAFDEKAIEYLCGRRGVKRKEKVMDEANIIEINGEDIKPDEREWLVKALTEEPAERPISMQSAGPSSQAKKKHQITYLAHQAKVMEVELKNQWAQNRLTRKQTQSKYGF
ncbi:proline-rich protein PRCC [Orussus abietinus]|uniref:proline-rich protein PRCC n=1 Tax=Orussus abietinus TaxID=222816 RepID=UPI000626D7DB|nr:proline-rich protein PRCC [Orussus abietinus]